MPDDRERETPEPEDDAAAGAAGAEADDPARVRRARAFRLLRDALGLQQQEVADRSGLTSGTVSDYERAKTNPDADSLERLFADGYGLPLYALEDAEDFVEWVSSLQGRTGGWRDSLLLRRGEAATGALRSHPATGSRLDRRLAASLGQAVGQAILRFFETLEAAGATEDEQKA